jgi:hypothetical protein
MSKRKLANWYVEKNEDGTIFIPFGINISRCKKGDPNNWCEISISFLAWSMVFLYAAKNY